MRFVVVFPVPKNINRISSQQIHRSWELNYLADTAFFPMRSVPGGGWRSTRIWHAHTNVTYAKATWYKSWVTFYVVTLLRYLGCASYFPFNPVILNPSIFHGFICLILILIWVCGSCCICSLCPITGERHPAGGAGRSSPSGGCGRHLSVFFVWTLDSWHLTCTKTGKKVNHESVKNSRIIIIWISVFMWIILLIVSWPKSKHCRNHPKTPQFSLLFSKEGMLLAVHLFPRAAFSRLLPGICGNGCGTIISCGYSAFYMRHTTALFVVTFQKSSLQFRIAKSHSQITSTV